jgi:hypothetical protein
MATSTQVASLFAKLDLDDSKFKAGLENARTGMSNLGGSISNVGRRVSGFGTKLRSDFGDDC